MGIFNKIINSLASTQKNNIKQVDNNDEKYINNEYFGKIMIENNLKKNCINGTVDNVSFGKYNTSMTIQSNDENELNTMIKDIIPIFSNYSIILNSTYEELKKLCDEYNIRDSSDKLLDNEYIEKNISLDFIFSSYSKEEECTYIEFVFSINDENQENLLGECTQIGVRIDCKTNKIYFHVYW